MEFKLLMDEAVRDVRAIGGLQWCDSIDEFLVQESFASRLMEQVKALQRNKGLSYLGITDNASLTATLITHFLGRMQWYKHGLQVFDVTDSLLAGLLLTTPTNEPGFPRFPFPSFVIRIPKGFIPIVGSAAVGGLPAWIAYILVNRFQGTSDNPEIVVMAANEGVSHRMNMPEWLHLKRFRSAAHYLREDEARWKQAASEGVGVWHDDWTTQRICMRLIFNLSSWIESMGGMAGWRPANAILRSANRKKTQITQWIVGKEVQFDPRIIVSAKEHVHGLDSRVTMEGWNLRINQVVRGLMRRQAVGAGRTEHKITWIKPRLREPNK